MSDCPRRVMLGSATPTLELLRHCRDGDYTRHVLPERAGGARPPRVRVVDTSRDYSEDGLSNALAEAIRSHLGAGGQALLFRALTAGLGVDADGMATEPARCTHPLLVILHGARSRRAMSWLHRSS